STTSRTYQPQWSPVNVTGNSMYASQPAPLGYFAAMEPGQRDREQGLRDGVVVLPDVAAAMEPGQRDREQAALFNSDPELKKLPQWSPVNVTGNRPRVPAQEVAHILGRNGA